MSMSNQIPRDRLIEPINLSGKIANAIELALQISQLSARELSETIIEIIQDHKKGDPSNILRGETSQTEIR